MRIASLGQRTPEFGSLSSPCFPCTSTCRLAFSSAQAIHPEEMKLPMQYETMTVTGMKCGGCPIKLSLALRGVSGVEDFQVSLASGEVTVHYDEHLTSTPQLKAMVIKTGFGVDGVKATNGHDPRPDYCG